MRPRYLTGKPVNPCCKAVVSALKQLAIRIVKDGGQPALPYAEQVDNLAGRLERGEFVREGQ